MGNSFKAMIFYFYYIILSANWPPSIHYYVFRFIIINLKTNFSGNFLEVSVTIWFNFVNTIPCDGNTISIDQKASSGLRYRETCVKSVLFFYKRFYTEWRKTWAMTVFATHNNIRPPFVRIANDDCPAKPADPYCRVCVSISVNFRIKWCVRPAI